MENKISYENLQQELKKVGLTLKNHRQHRSMKGVMFQADVESEVGPVTVCKGAVYESLRASGRTPNEVAQNILKKIIKGDFVLIGTYENYKEKVVYENGSLKKIELTKQELLHFNLP